MYWMYCLIYFQKNRNTCMYIIIVDNFRTEHVTISAMFSRELHSTTKTYKGAEYSNFVRLGSILDILKTIAGCHNLSLFFQQPALIVSNIRYAVLFCLSPIGKLYAPHCCFISNKFTLRANSVLKLLA